MKKNHFSVVGATSVAKHCCLMSSVGHCTLDKKKHTGICALNIEITESSVVCVLGKPEPPSGRIKVRKVTGDSVVLEWNSPYSTGGVRLMGYLIEYRDTDSHMWSKAASVDSFTSSITISGLKDNKEYLFRVIAFNEFGESDPLEVDLAVRPLKRAGNTSTQYVLWLLCY